MRRISLVFGVIFGLMMATGPGPADAQSAMREDVFDLQTALHYFQFMSGPVDGEIGADTERGLRGLGSYLRLGPISPEAMETTPLPLPLRSLMDAYVGRNDIDTTLLDERDLGRLNREGDRFWIRKELQPDPSTWGVDVDAAADTCSAYSNEGLIGTVIDPDELPEIEGPASVRVIYYGPVTADFRPDRLNIFVDPWNMVTKLTCN